MLAVEPQIYNKRLVKIGGSTILPYELAFVRLSLVLSGFVDILQNMFKLIQNVVLESLVNISTKVYAQTQKLPKIHGAGSEQSLIV